MRKIMKKRLFHLPRIAALLLLACSVILFGNAECKSEEAASKTHNTLSDGTVISTVSDSASTENAAQESRTAVILGRPEEEDTRQEAPAPVYHDSVYNALKRQGLSKEHIELWCDEHPVSTLNKLETLEPAMQKKVANAASYIRKVNPKISAKTAWREAMALVYYSVKYGIPSDLVISVAKAESRFNPGAQSKSGALGVMQVMWKVHNAMLRNRGIAATREHMFDPERGVEAGVLILSRYVKVYGTLQKALNRYYGGIAQSYLKKVSNNMAHLQKHTANTGY
ncbi:MAG: lytic transglycosylase domain-containing protein [Synergistes jonesii]|uniref:lytic transglycosylase domain-containing protein n=1 Tax=Synergistes jonesii TaxID=2754 RepID=UPI002A76168D|nr:lytic transglycosylase domain-containing protein [Synergistes jonesii]MDY2985364.1 lytic transglycosylase domain-containing protein [Synergistes jonesii]